MSNAEFLTYEALGVAAVLETEFLEVPMYQRSYSWRTREEKDTEESAEIRAQVPEFWDDLMRGHQRGRPYFLGTVVLTNEAESAGRKSVIDGQQRLATTCLLMAAIRNAYRERGEVAYAGSIHSDFVAKFDRHAGKDQPKLILNSDDRDFFDKLVVQVVPGQVANCESQRLLQAAWNDLQAKVLSFCDSQGASWKNALDQFSTYLQSSAQVIMITVPTEADAFLIFETLNDRGADLTVADLLKNYLFSHSGTRLDEVRDAWVITLNNLDTPRAGNSRFTLFARHYMSSRKGIVRERELYSRIKEEVVDSASAVNFAKELAVNSRLYFALLSVDSDVWGEFGEQTRQAAEVLVDFNLGQSRPMLLAALATFEKAEVERLLRTMVCWSVRGLAAGRLGGGVAEAAFCTVAQRIRAKKIKTTEDILKDPGIDNLVSTDKAFRADFAEWSLVKGSLARYILRALELEERGDDEPELVVNPDVSKVNLEHILPKSPKGDQWSSFTPDEHRLYVHRIGNMALLQKGVNGRIGNKPWSVKKPILASSNLQLTRSAADETAWTPEAIDARQAELADLALRAWPREPR
ncbi:MAG: DUF262 domain-containing protein [Actinobacteria bacterium]|nr:DUF262 domain-containing protein [Actinomycetota bacterium]